MKNSRLKSPSTVPAHFETQQGPILPVMKSFQQIKKILALYSYEIINSI